LLFNCRQSRLGAWWLGVVAAVMLPACIFVASHACHYVTTALRSPFQHAIPSADRPPGIPAYDALPRVRYPQVREPFVDWTASILPSGWRGLEFSSIWPGWRVLVVYAMVWSMGLVMLWAAWWTWTLIRHRDEAPGVLWKSGQWRGVACWSFRDAAWRTVVRVTLVALFIGSLAEVVVPPFVSVAAVYSLHWHSWIQWIAVLITPSVFLRNLTRAAAEHTRSTLADSHCDRCGYSLEGLAKRACPECGESSSERGRASRWLSTRVLALLAVGVCLLVSGVWAWSGSYVPDLLFRVVPMQAMHADVRDFGRGTGRPVQLGMNTWSVLIPSYEGVDLTGYHVLVRVDEVEFLAGRPSKARVRCVFGNPDEGFLRWRRGGFAASQRPTLQEMLASSNLFAWCGELRDGLPTTVMIGHQHVSAKLVHGNGWDGASTVTLTMHRSVQSGGSSNLRFEHYPISDVMDALDWTCFEKRPADLGSCPAPVRVRDMPRLPPAQ
jgi:predicted RNA-binding Zn-ribbon protein involved in translation (DUF1610 family)